MEIQSGEIFAFFPSYSFSEFAEAYKLSLKEKAAKQLFKRLNAYAGAIKTLIKDELRQWPMRAFVKNPFPLEFNFSNKSGMAATVKLVDASS